MCIFSIHGGSSVRTYLDCHWITTQVLHRHALKVPTDTDLIVGYMYQVRFMPTPLRWNTVSHLLVTTRRRRNFSDLNRRYRVGTFSIYSPSFEMCSIQSFMKCLSLDKSLFVLSKNTIMYLHVVLFITFFRGVSCFFWLIIHKKCWQLGRDAMIFTEGNVPQNRKVSLEIFNLPDRV